MFYPSAAGSCFFESSIVGWRRSFHYKAALGIIWLWSRACLPAASVGGGFMMMMKHAGFVVKHLCTSRSRSTDTWGTSCFDVVGFFFHNIVLSHLQHLVSVTAPPFLDSPAKHDQNV